MMQRAVVGRERELELISHALDLPESRVLSVSGIAGVGKSTLVSCGLDLARERHFLAVAINLRDTVSSPDPGVVSLLRSAVRWRQASSGLSLARTQRTIERYEDARQRLLAQFRGNEEEAGELLRVGLEAARTGLSLVPGGSIAERALSPELAAAISGAIRAHGDRQERRLLEDPGYHLAQALLEDARQAATRDHGLLLAIDEYEHVNYQIDAWLRRLLAGHFGELPSRTTAIIAGRLSLGRDWLAGAGHAPRVTHLPLDELTSEAVVQYLHAALETTGMSDRAAEVAEMLGPLGRLPVLLERAAADPNRLLMHQERASQSPNGSYDWGAALEEYVHRISEATGSTSSHRLALRALAVPRRLDARRARIVLDAARISHDDEFVDWLEREDLVDPRAPAFTMYEPIRHVLVGSLGQHDPQLLSSLHEELAAHFEEVIRTSTNMRERAEAQRDRTYHAVLAGVSNPVATCLRGMIESLPDVYLDLPQWATAIGELHYALQGAQAQQRRDLLRLSEALGLAWRLSTPWELAEKDALALLTGDFLLYQVLGLDPPVVDEQNASHWLELFVVRANRLSQEIDLLLEAADTLLRNLYRKCEQNFGEEEQRLLKLCVAYELAEVSQLQGRVSQAVFWSERARDLLPDAASPLLTAMTRASLAANLKRSTEFRHAMREFQESISCFRNLDGTWNDPLSGIMLELANCHLYLGETTDAAQVLDQLAEMGIGDHRQAELRHRLGWRRRLEGDLDGSVSEHEAAIVAYDALLASGELTKSAGPTTIRSLRAKAQHSLANTLTEMHRLSEAHALFAEAIAYFDSHGMRRHAGIATKDFVPCLYFLEGFNLSSEAHETALRLLDIGKESGAVNASHIAEGCMAFARIAALEGRTDQALAELDRARDAVDKLEREARRLLEARWYLERGLIASMSGDPIAAYEFLPRVSTYAAGARPVRHDLLALVEFVRAVVAARAVDLEEGLVAFHASRDVASQWNRYLLHDLERLWSRAISTAGITNRSVELLDTYDPDGQELEPQLSTVVHEEGLWHRSFHCWITDLDDSGRARLILQRRGPNKRDFPNYLDISVAGHYRAGEGLEGGLREIREELGLLVSKDDLAPIARRTVEEDLYNGTRNREWQDIYWLHRARVDLGALEIGYPEVGAVIRCRLDLVEELFLGEVGSVRGEVALAHAGAQSLSSPIDVTLADFISESREYLVAVFRTLRARLAGSATAGSAELRLNDGSHWQTLG